MVADAVLYGSVACGLIAGLLGNRTAWPLLASVGTAILLEQMGVPFNPWLWMLIDFMVLLAIMVMVLQDMLRFDDSDAIIVGLFPIAWIFYAFDDHPILRYGTLAVVATQFLLTIPYRRIWYGVYDRLQGKPQGRERGDDDTTGREMVLAFKRYTWGTTGSTR